MPVVSSRVARARASGLALGLFMAAALGATPAVTAQDRPVPTSDPVPLQPGPPPANFTVIGVVIGPDRSLVFLQEPALTQNNVVTLTRGGSVGPYRVTQIESDRIMLELEGRTYALLFARHGGGGAVASAPQVSGGAGTGSVQIETDSRGGRAKASADSGTGSGSSGKGERRSQRARAPQAVTQDSSADPQPAAGSEPSSDRAGRKGKSATSRQSRQEGDLPAEARRAQVEARIKEAMEQAASRGTQNRVTAPAELMRTFGVSPAK